MPRMNKSILNEFNLREDLAYLNHAGVSPWPRRTAEAVRKFADENLYEGSARYLEWLKVEESLKRKAGELINAPSSNDIALLKNTSEALSIVAYGIDWSAGDNIVSSNDEFPSNRIVWQSLAKRGVEFREADLKSAASPEEALFSLVDAKTRLLTISSVQFSTGLKTDLNTVGQFCKDKNILFCVDAIQSVGAVPFDVMDIQADFVMADGHKWMLGPEGLAIFYSSPASRDRLTLNQYGWHMVRALGDFDRRDWEPSLTARRFECGSPNMIGIHALQASLSLLLEAGMESVEKEVLRRSEYLMNIIDSRHELELITSREQGRYAGIVTFQRLNRDNGALYEYLMSNRVICAHRSGGIRFSPHFYSPIEHLDRGIEMVLEF